ncbi:MAG: hypothetical protein MZU95_08240 [Desulfomicrobium escambiense]|nr:hypothetical protein [Desulfomicrobium escambiense]
MIKDEQGRIAEAETAFPIPPASNRPVGIKEIEDQIAQTREHAVLPGPTSRSTRTGPASSP